MTGTQSSTAPPPALASPEWLQASVPVPYPQALDFMDARVAAIAEGYARELVWLLEHPPLYTAGTSAAAAELLQARFPVYPAGRGGRYTYHGPGQRVAYVLLDLRRHGLDVRCYVQALEEWLIRALAQLGVTGRRVAGRVGIWTETAPGQLAKIAALGVRIRRGITLHGVAVNVCPDLDHFAGIVPCGIADAGVTSLAALGRCADMAALDAALRAEFGCVLRSDCIAPATKER